MLVESCINLLETIHNKEWGANKISPSLPDGNDQAFGAVIDQIFEEFTKREFRLELIKSIEERVSQSPPHSPITKDQFTKIVHESTVEFRRNSPILEHVDQGSSSGLDQAATTIQTQVRRYLKQKKVILPNQIKEFIAVNFPDMSQSESDALTKIIARQSIAILENPKAFQGEGKRINQMVENKFTDPVTKETKTVKTPRTIWVYLTDDQKQLRVQVYSKKLMGEGTYKIVKASKTLVFHLSGGLDKKKKVVSTVYIKSKDIVTEEERRSYPGRVIRQFEEEDIAKLRYGMNEAARVFSKEELAQDEAIHIKALPDVTHTYIGKKYRKRLEWEEPMYFGSDFLEVLKAGSVQVDDGVTVKMTSPDKLRIVKSTLYTAQKMHEKGVVHRDVKSQNVFLGYDGKLQGYLGDFDLIAKVGHNELKSPYAYWDLPSCKGLVLPTADIFGSAMVLGESFLGSTFYHVSQMRFNDLHEVAIPQAIDSRVNLKSKVLLSDLQLRLSSKLDAADQQAISTAISKFEESEGSQEAMLIIRDHMTNSKNPEMIREYKKLIADLELIAKTGELLKEVFVADRELDQYLCDPRNRELTTTLASGGTKNALATLYNKFPTFKNLLETITALETQWIETSES